ncbi:MAG: DUF4352 domain-containing protein [Oscillospiraceae bacterium]|nr:DUF4352 domain-containing protein [Oscillospiraceae bacterium]
MKKFISIMLVVLMLALVGVGLMGCDGGESVGGRDNVGLNDRVVLRDVAITAETIVIVEPASEFGRPSEGNKFVGVRFRIENTSNSTRNVSSLMEFETFVSGTSLSWSIAADMANPGESLNGAILAGYSMVGYLMFEVSEGTESVRIRYNPDLLRERDLTWFVLDVPSS